MTEPAEQRKSLFRSRGFKVAVIIVAVLIVLWVAVEIAAPLIADYVARNQITKRYPDATDVSVSIRAFPALKLAFKKYDSLTVNVSGITLQGVKFDHIELKSKDWPVGTFAATIAQDEIERFFSLKNSYVLDPKLSIDESGLLVAGNVEVSGRKVAVSARGTLKAVDGKKVYFQPSDIQVMDVKVPEEAVARVRQVMDLNPVFVVRDDLPYDITGIAVEQGKLVILGRADLEKALNIKL